jgi:CheY-like chemotaxis protein
VVASEISGETSVPQQTPEPTTDSRTSGLDTPWPSQATDVDDAETIDLIAELDAVAPPHGDGPPRVLIVDDDFATRHFLVKELQPLGYLTATSASGGEAVRAIRQATPDLIVSDILLPEIDGFRLCRAIKRSRPLTMVPVVLMSAVIDSGRVTDDVLARYGADAYLEKPLDTRRVHRVIRELLGRRRGKSVSGETGFQRAIELYQRGDVDGAIALLRVAVDADPSSAKYRFVLANLLQLKAQTSEAIDEYESVVQLEPDYFPALTRLAYLYYKQGLLARAVDTWRRSLPLCADPGLRRNIELFMRKLIHEMGTLQI